MRYYSRSEMAPAALQSLLEKFEGVTSVKFDGDDGTVSFQYSGSYRGLVDIEKATMRAGVPAALLSHAYVVLAYKPTKGFEAAKLKSALQGVSGVKYVCCVMKSVSDFYADVKTLDLEKLVKAAEDAGCKAQLKTHETVELTVKGGDVKAFINAMMHQKKMLVGIQKDDKVIFKTLKKIVDGAFRQYANKHKVEIEKITRR